MNNFNMQRAQTINILFNGDFKKVKRDSLYKFLLQKTSIPYSYYIYFNKRLGVQYEGVYDFILSNLHEIDNIQIYKDYAVLLYDNDRDNQIIFEDTKFCKSPETKMLVEQLLEFVS